MLKLEKNFGSISSYKVSRVQKVRVVSKLELESCDMKKPTARSRIHFSGLRVGSATYDLKPVDPTTRICTLHELCRAVRAFAARANLGAGC